MRNRSQANCFPETIQIANCIFYKYLIPAKDWPRKPVTLAVLFIHLIWIWMKFQMTFFHSNLQLIFLNTKSFIHDLLSIYHKHSLVFAIKENIHLRKKCKIWFAAGLYVPLLHYFLFAFFVQLDEIQLRWRLKHASLDRLAAKLARKESLSQKLQQRPGRQELIDRNILYQVTEEERKVDRSIIGAKLIRRLSLRPTPEELEERNILKSNSFFL